MQVKRAAEAVLYHLSILFIFSAKYTPSLSTKLIINNLRVNYNTAGVLILGYPIIMSSAGIIKM